MTDQEATTEPVVMPEREIDFRGRSIWVHFPSPEQLIVWQRVLDRLQRDGGGTTGHEVMRALTRLRAILDSIIVNQVDIEWVDDEMLAGRLGLMELVPMLNDTVKAFANEPVAGTRPEKRAAAKKAVRKAPARRPA